MNVFSEVKISKKKTNNPQKSFFLHFIPQKELNCRNFRTTGTVPHATVSIFTARSCLSSTHYPSLPGHRHSLYRKPVHAKQSAKKT